MLTTKRDLEYAKAKFEEERSWWKELVAEVRLRDAINQAQIVELRAQIESERKRSAELTDKLMELATRPAPAAIPIDDGPDYGDENMARARAFMQRDKEALEVEEATMSSSRVLDGDDDDEKMIWLEPARALRELEDAGIDPETGVLADDEEPDGDAE